MRQILAAIRSGTDPVAPLPSATFHRTLEDTLACPKCHVTYSLVTDYDWATTLHFPAESQRHLALLRKAIFLEHTSEHRTTHFETNGVVVTCHARRPPSVVAPLPRHIM